MSRDGAQVRDAAPLFAALGDETRYRLLVRLATNGGGSISELSARAGVTRQAITKHLAVLADAGLVKSRREGREQLWELAPTRLADAHAYLEGISRQWDQALGRLKALVESE